MTLSIEAANIHADADFPVAGLDEGDSLEEFLYYSACMTDGVFDPGGDGLGRTDFPATADIYRLMEDYAERSGAAAPSALVKRLFPEFHHITGVDRSWAAERLRDSTRNRAALRLAKTIVEDVRRDSPSWLVEQRIREYVEGLANHASTGIDLMDVTEEPARSTIPVSYEGLRRAGGMSDGQLVLIAGRPGDGKSWRLVQHAVDAARAGRTVYYYSLEMTAAEMAKRFALVLLGRSAVAMQPAERAERMRALLRGRIVIRDQTYGPCTPGIIARDVSAGDVAVVDYVGLMTSGHFDGSKAGHEVAKDIATGLTTACKSRRALVIAGVQLNRTAAGSGDRFGVEALAQTDALGQNADMVVALRRPAEDVTSNIVLKARHGESGVKWFSMFEPVGRGFSEIDREDAWSAIDEKG